MMKTIGILFFILYIPACAGTVMTVDGIEVYEKYWTQATQDLSRRVKFDTNCESIPEFHLLARSGRHPSEIGVIACGQRLTYTRTVVSGMSTGGTGHIGEWQLNSGGLSDNSKQSKHDEVQETSPESEITN